MCLCNPDVREHVLFQITPTVGSREYGVKLHCNGNVELVGDYHPSPDTMLLFQLLATRAPRWPIWGLPQSQEGVEWENLTGFLIKPQLAGKLTAQGSGEPEDPLPSFDPTYEDRLG